MKGTVENLIAICAETVLTAFKILIYFVFFSPPVRTHAYNMQVFFRKRVIVAARCAILLLKKRTRKKRARDEAAVILDSSLLLVISCNLSLAETKRLDTTEIMLSGCSRGCVTINQKQITGTFFFRVCVWQHPSNTLVIIQPPFLICSWFNTTAPGTNFNIYNKKAVTSNDSKENIH